MLGPTLTYRLPRCVTCGALALAAGAAQLLTTAGSARADCAPPDARVVWSSPAAGAVDVPVDADLLILTERIDLESAEVSLFIGGLIELPLQSDGVVPGHFGLPELDPNQAHTIVLRPQDGTPITIAFTTGQRRASGENGTVDLVSISQEPYAEGLVEDELCHDVLFRNSCFDTGVPLLQELEVDMGAAPVAEHSLWAIETVRAEDDEPTLQFWPAACGSPHQWGGFFDAEYRLYNIGESGVIRESDSLAYAVEAPPPPMPPRVAQADTDPTRGISCSVSVEHGPSAPSLVAASALALGALCGRRRGRARAFALRQ
jgi:hypothetical protein